MKAEFHTVQLNQTIKRVRVKILRSEYLAFLTFFSCFAYIKPVFSHSLYHRLQLLSTLLGPSGFCEYGNNVSRGRTVF